MASRSVIATPRDVYPRDGNCINFNVEYEGEIWGRFSLTNMCDTLTFLRHIIYDATTNERVGEYFLRNGVLQDGSGNLKYMKGDTINVLIPNYNFISGRHYKYKIISYTNFIDERIGNIGQPNPCVPYASGMVLNVFYNSSLQIQDNIVKLYPRYYWHKGQADEVLVGCTYMRIGNEMRMITDYDSKTGFVTLESGFSNEALGNRKNLQYFLYCNYIEDAWYDFYYREDIKSNTVLTTGSFGLHCLSTYTHPNHIGMETYRYKVYAKSNDDYVNGTIQDITVARNQVALQTGITQNIVGKTIVIAKTTGSSNEAVTEGYSSTILHYNSATGIATLRSAITEEIQVGAKYTIQLGTETLLDDSGKLNTQLKEADFMVYPYQPMNVVTELTSYEKQMYSATNSLNITPDTNTPVTSNTVDVNEDNQRVEINFRANRSLDNYFTHIYRRDSDEGLWRIAGFRQQDINSKYPTTNSTFVDFMAGNNRQYEYAIVPLARSEDSQTYFRPYTIQGVETNWDGWTITSLMDYDKYIEQNQDRTNFVTLYEKYSKRQNNKKFYKAMETWHFISDIDSGDIAHNLGLLTHVGTSTFPTVSRTNNNYESGSFTTNLLSLECPDGMIYDDIEKVERWKKFINGDNLFILKSDKGDVWIISIAENLSRSYDESTSLVLTKVSYSWVQVEDNNNVIII